MSVDIIIVNWNSGNYLRKCLTSIFTDENIPFINKVIVIDNNSKDNSVENFIESHKLILIKNDQNIGFSKACNQGFKICSAKYVLLFNPDAQLLENTLKECFLFMETRKDIDILGCQLLDDDGNVSISCARFPTPRAFFYKSLGLANIFPKIFTPPDLMFDMDHSESTYVDQVMGAFMFMRKEIFDTIGYFDERFFVYFEELDFSKRLAEAGGKTYFNAGIKAIHSGHGTTKSVKAFRIFLFLKSRLLYAKKHFSKTAYVVVLLSTTLIEPFSRIFFFLFQAKLKEVFQVMKGYQLLLKSLSSKAIQ
jgi:N-acetylglucosaminyl-diphospho-decaprenol L-rhamnosyltransferase